jgi:enoyl-CoA hydratase
MDDIATTKIELMKRRWGPSMKTDPEFLRRIVKYDKDPARRVATITFDYPEARNAKPVAAGELMEFYIRDAEHDDNISTIVLRGAGDCFGVGGDATELGHYIGYSETKSGERPKRPFQRDRMLPDKNIIFAGVERTLYECLKVTIAAVHGYCYGAHLQFAMASDIVIATPDAIFAHPAIRYIGPGSMNAHMWIENFGLKRFKEIVLTGRPIDAEEARLAGFVNSIVERDELDREVDDYAGAIAMLSLDSIMIGKAMINAYLEGTGKGLGTALAIAGHGWSTNQVLGKDEWNFLKERRDHGVTAALRERDERVAPKFRMSRRSRKGV